MKAAVFFALIGLAEINRSMMAHFIILVFIFLILLSRFRQCRRVVLDQ